MLIEHSAWALQAGLQSRSTDSVLGATVLPCPACGIFLTRAGTHVPCFGRWILIYCATRKSQQTLSSQTLVCYHIRYLFFSLFWLLRAPKNNLGFLFLKTDTALSISHVLINYICLLFIYDQFHCPIYKYACCGNTCLWLRKKNVYFKAKMLLLL